MENLFTILANRFALRFSPSRRFKKYSIGTTGCSIKMSSDPGVFHSAKTITNDLMHFGESLDSHGVTYGVMAIELNQPTTSIAQAERILAHFMNNLHDSFQILHTTGLDCGYVHASNPQMTGIVDYWQDADRVDWKVKGWTNGKMVAALYVRNISNIPVGKQEYFLNGLSFD